MTAGHWVGVAWAVLALAFIIIVPAFLTIRDAWRDCRKDLP